MLWLANGKILDVERGRYKNGTLVVEGERIVESNLTAFRKGREAASELA